MSLKKKLIIFSLVSILASSVAGFITLNNTASLHKETQKQELTSQILRQTFEQALLRDQYLLYGEDRSIEQWHIIQENINQLLLQASKLTTNANEQTFLQRFSDNSKAAENLFLQLTDSTGQQQATPSAIELAREKRLEAQFLIKSQENITIISQLESLSRSRVEKIQKNNSLLTTLFTMFLNGIIIATIAWVWLYVVKPLALFQNTVDALAKQKFSSIDIRSNDEIGLLARSFNIMSENLKHAYTSLNVQMNQLNEKTVESEKRAQEFEKINKLVVNRELKMIELKNEINELKEKTKQFKHA